ncbi:MAG TPA: nucleotidyltransferase domain-containing protein [Planctomycetota bacterium]|nr:nucleotidyltransferase domain-containing protein [Planctomycetota bacterium]
MLDKLLGSKLRARVIGWFYTHPDERYFVRQLTALLGEDSTNLSRELARLADLGVLTREEEGRQKYYRANPQCAVFSELRSMAVKTFGVGDILSAALAPLADHIRAAFIYGSFARGEEQARSDVDVMIVGDATFGDVVEALHPVQEKLGREVNPTVYPEAEFREKLAAGHHFLTSVFSAPKIFLRGDERDLAGLAEK